MERADGLLRVAAVRYTLSLDKLFTLPTDEVGEGLFDQDNPNSLRVILTRARENARGVQDHITKEVWEAVNAIYHLVEGHSLEDQFSSFGALHVMEQFTRHCVLYAGITDITMPRGVGWNFMNLGKYMERSLQTLALSDKEFQVIDYNMEETRDIMQWRYLLLCLSGYELHLKTYRSSSYNFNALHQVLFNEDFPHSLIYSLTRLQRHLNAIVKENRSPESEALLRHFGRIYSKAKYMDPESINGRTLQQLFGETRTELLLFGRRLGQHFFSYS
jgi:uncharacterized alpha-E superfamily protein